MYGGPRGALSNTRGVAPLPGVVSLAPSYGSAATLPAEPAAEVAQCDLARTAEVRCKSEARTHGSVSGRPGVAFRS